MIDQQKRKTLTLITGTGLGLAMASVPIVANAAAGDSPLAIEILADRAMRGDTVILRNNTAGTMVIENFQPGIVVSKDNIMDLNVLCGTDKVILAPKQVFSATVAQWHLLAKPMLEQKLWTDISAFTPDDGTRHIRLNAVVKGQQAILSVAHTQALT